MFESRIWRKTEGKKEEVGEHTQGRERQEQKKMKLRKKIKQKNHTDNGRKQSSAKKCQKEGK